MEADAFSLLVPSPVDDCPEAFVVRANELLSWATTMVKTLDNFKAEYPNVDGIGKLKKKVKAEIEFLSSVRFFPCVL